MCRFGSLSHFRQYMDTCKSLHPSGLDGPCFLGFKKRGRRRSSFINPVRALQTPPRMLKPETYKARIQGMWESRGGSYDSSDTFHQALAEELVQVASPLPGHSVLDVATGTGMVALPVAQRVASGGGQVVGIDISASMLAEAERKAKEHKLSNLTFQLGDAETAIFEESSFDSILCSSGLIYLQDHDAALRRFLQWLKPGGKLCFNTPQEPCVPATAVFYEVLADKLGVHLADAAAPLANRSVITKLCLRSGFATVTIKSTEEVILYEGCTPQDYAAKIWRSLGQNAIFTPLDGLVSDGDLDRLVKPVFTEKTIEMARSWVVAEGVANPYTMLWVVAVKGF